MSYIMDLRKIVGHRPLLMPCAGAIIGDGKGNILLQQRVDDGTWANHGGSIELDEEVEQAMIREVKEELGITLLEYKLFNIYSGPNHHHIYPNGDEVSCIDIVYVCERFEGEISLQKEEVRQVKWFNKETLPENIHHNCKQAILEYLSQF